MEISKDRKDVIVTEIKKYQQAINAVTPQMLYGDRTLMIAWTIAQQFNVSYFTAFDLVREANRSCQPSEIRKKSMSATANQ